MSVLPSTTRSPRGDLAKLVAMGLGGVSCTESGQPNRVVESIESVSSLPCQARQQPNTFTAESTGAVVASVSLPPTPSAQANARTLLLLLPSTTHPLSAIHHFIHRHSHAPVPSIANHAAHDTLQHTAKLPSEAFLETLSALFNARRRPHHLLCELRCAPICIVTCSKLTLLFLQVSTASFRLVSSFTAL